MRILGLDVSTTSTGSFLIDTEFPELSHFKLFTAKGDTLERINSIAKQVHTHYGPYKSNIDVVVVSKATHYVNNTWITMLEGIMLGIATAWGVKFDYNPDVSWYSFIGNIKDNRNIKKETTMKFFKDKWLTKSSWKPTSELDISYEGGRLKNISVEAENVETMQTTTITDDIADAFACAYLYPKRVEKLSLEKYKRELQDNINSIRSDNGKLRNKVSLLESKMKKNYLENKQLQRDYEHEQSNKLLKMIEKRRERIASCQLEIENITLSIASNESKIKELTEEKNK